MFALRIDKEEYKRCTTKLYTVDVMQLLFYIYTFPSTTTATHVRRHSCVSLLCDQLNHNLKTACKKMSKQINTRSEA